MDPESEKETGSHITPEIAEYPEAGPYWVGLWAVAQHWVAVCADIFEPGLLASPGITRRFALRCCNWLWAIEGLVRRLIIAAAMKLDVSQLPKPVAGKPRSNAAPTRPHAVAFFVLPRLPGGRKRSSGKPPPAKAPEPRHIGFPGDALLMLFKRKAQPSRAHRRFANPLHRRGPWSPRDPDYTDDPARTEAANRRWFLYGRDAARMGQSAPPVLDREPRQRTRPDRSSPYWRPRNFSSGGDIPEWKRLEQEWERIVPAPSLAGRIRALVRVMQAPERWIARAARRLGPELLTRLRELPTPKLRKPKLDRTPPGFLEEPLAQSHALLDTS